MSDRPPPLPLCSRTSITITILVMIRITESPMIMPGLPLRLYGVDGLVPTLGYRQFPVPAYLSELVRVEACAADHGAVHVRLRHDRRNVAGFNGPAIQDTHTDPGFGAMNRRNASSDRRASLLGVLRCRHLTGPDGPDRLIRHNHPGDGLGRHLGQRAVKLGECIRYVVAGPAHLERLPHAHDRRQRGPQTGLHLLVHDRVGFGVILPALRVPHDHVCAAELGQHRSGDLPGVRAGVVRRYVLRAVPDLQLVAADQRLHAAQRGERRQHGDLGERVVLVGQRERELLHERDGLEVVLVHLPVAGHQRQPLAPLAHSASSAVSPGSVLPSRYSSDAPPPVEMWLNLSSPMPSARTAAAESPPPTTVSPFTAATASATARVPAENGGTSNTPAGPFQNTVRASASLARNNSRVRGPASTPSQSAGMPSAGTTVCSASGANFAATTMSTGSTSSTPRDAASASTAFTSSILSASSTELPTS